MKIRGIFLFFFLLISIVASLSLGALGPLSLDNWQMALELRGPRTLMAGAVGMGLSVAGVILQAIFSNPLCEPYVLGVSSGAGIGAVLVVALGMSSALSIFLGSSVGAIAAISILLLISLKKNVGKTGLLLVGVFLGSFGSSVISLWVTYAEMASTSIVAQWTIRHWLLGDLSRVDTQLGFTVLAAVTLISAWTQRWSTGMDALLMGEEWASSVGVNVRRVRRELMFVAGLLVSLSVGFAGMIGFVGLVVPHTMRMLFGALHRNLIWAAAVAGAATLICADTFCRSISAAGELPIGAVTSLLGAPTLLILIFRNRRLS